MTIQFNPIFQAISWFLPILFMALYHIKTEKFNNLFYPAIAFLFSLPIIDFVIEMPFFQDVILCYSIFMVSGLLVLKSRYNFFQAVSITFILAFLSSVYWETPIILYTIYVRGYVDQAMPLHLISVLPLPFLIQKVKFGKNTIPLFLCGLGVSAVFLIVLLAFNIDIHDSITGPNRLLMATVWTINRIISFAFLLYIVYRSEKR